MNFDLPVSALVGVGPKVEAALGRLDIFVLQDLLWHIPFRYINAEAPQRIDDLVVGEESVINAEIEKVTEKVTAKKRLKLIEATLSDESGCVKAVWFNQPFLKSSLVVGQKKIFIGKIGMDWQTRQKNFQSPLIFSKPQVIPVYHETNGVTSALIRKLIQQILPTIQEFKDPLPLGVIEDYHLISRGEALVQVHQPPNFASINPARRRLGFDELVWLGLYIRLAGEVTGESPIISFPEETIRKFVSNLPFKLTNAQRKTAWQILNDLKRTQPMNRLLMGDVGSGKTVVGSLGTLAVAKAGYQTLWLAPTEVLAFQHYQTLSRLYADQKIKVGIWTGSKKESDLEKDLVIVGTHALLETTCKFGKIGLIIVDEQHRFGVKQRARLKELHDSAPHYLSMTATPIPRTLALTLYGNLDISILDEMPADRKPILTRVVTPDGRSQAYEAVRQEISKGRQAFVITPLVDESTTSSGKLFEDDKKAAVIEQERLQKDIFPDFKIGLMHGRMKPKEKNEVMEKFKTGEINILVATAVVEVGIDIPNASIMLIENADRFGLAQLHQFRGRVGRGAHQSYCLLFSETNSPKSFERLQAMVEYQSGFKLAEIDLKLRGPGSLAGLKQSGLPDLRLATLTDTLAIEEAREAVTRLLEEGISSELEAEIQRLAQTTHME